MTHALTAGGNLAMLQWFVFLRERPVSQERYRVYCRARVLYSGWQ